MAMRTKTASGAPLLRFSIDEAAQAARRYGERKRRMSLKGFNVDWVLTLDTNLAVHRPGGGDPVTAVQRFCGAAFPSPTLKAESATR
jgi:hypothetical protein